MAEQGKTSYSFKVSFNGIVSRFRMPCNACAWDEFISLLNDQIFKGSGYHKELLLQDITSDNIINITSVSEWDTLLAQHTNTELIRLNVMEGSGFYFKDAAPPTPLYFYQSNEKIYKTHVQYPDEDQWCPYSQLIISSEPKSVCLSGITLNGVARTHKKGIFRLSWPHASNESSGTIYFDADGSFVGNLTYKEGEEVLQFKGVEIKEQIQVSQGEPFATATPSCLSAFFPDGKILPYHLPAELKEVVKVITLENGELDLDVDMGKLYHVTHNRGIEEIQAGRYEEAKKFLFQTEKLQPDNAIVMYNIACAFALDNDASSAVMYLEKAAKNGFSDKNALLNDKDLLSLHPNPKFQAFVASF